MSNWFEDNPLKSIIGHTVLVMTFTWGISTFVLEDRKLSDVKSQLETQKSVTEEYKVKVEILQKDIEKLQAENSEYKLWLEKEGKVVPSIIVSKNLQMQEEIKNLRSMLKDSAMGVEYKHNLSVGTAYIDNGLDISMTLDKVFYGNKASIYIRFPDSNENVKYENIKAGDVKIFKKDNKKHKITFTKVLFIQDLVEFTIDSSN
ncbi:hypothetical protein [Acinetobacter sp. NIPH 298]|uniref:hypothetical protein n=1 Tax=Acinetobacter sp. NIPH 298 TaxID=1217692 RepID=UPI0002CE67BE|nr:hypothetical protein [Acinetobacter sp. NIPH 298]ENW97793.1 hypothetical protein F903_00316 [Acinetobacter sp. NIPH 298]